MKFLTKLGATLLCAALAFSAIAIPVAEAQVPSIGYVAPAQLRTYRATFTALVPAASATDFLTIGGATGVVQVHWIKCNGISTAAATAFIQVIKRSAADTTGTSTTATNVRLNAGQPAATAVVKGYTVNPGALGAAIGTVDAALLSTNTLATSAFASKDLVFDFSNQNMFLEAATTYLVLNANATSLTSGASLNCTVEWNE